MSAQSQESGQPERLTQEIRRALERLGIDATGELLSDLGVRLVTQYGNADRLANGRPFRRQPRPQDRAGLSVHGGLVSLQTLVQVLSAGTPRHVAPGDMMRIASVDGLAVAGFEVVPDPTRRNPKHTRIEYPGDWSDDVCERFDQCWTSPLMGSDDAEEDQGGDA